MLQRLSLSCLVLMALCFTACSSKQPAGSDASKAGGKPGERITGESESSALPFQDEPAAHALYNQMMEAMRKAESLSYTGQYSIEGYGREECTYRMWLKKPNYFRVETEYENQKTGVLIGDGKDLWIYWPQGRPKWSSEEGEESEADKKARLTSYMTEPAPVGGHSIGHKTTCLGCGLMPIIDPSTFHGYTDSLQPYLDAVRSLPGEKVGEEDCDKIELSIMKHQRSWCLWLSKRDHIPRKLQEIVRVSRDILINEQWTSVTLNADIPSTFFAWKPPEGWTRWKEPPMEAGLLKPGAKAPDFDLVSVDGKRIKLSDYRGRIVWFYVWRAG